MDFPVGPFEKMRLSILYESGLLDGDANPVLEELCREARERFQVSTALVTLLEEDVQTFRASCGSQSQSTPRDVAFCNHTILTDDLFIVQDAQTHPTFQSNPMVIGPPFIRFYAGAPLIYMENIRLGAFCVMDGSPGDLDADDREELRELSDRAVSELVRMIMNVA